MKLNPGILIILSIGLLFLAKLSQQHYQPKTMTMNIIALFLTTGLTFAPAEGFRTNLGRDNSLESALVQDKVHQLHKREYIDPPPFIPPGLRDWWITPCGPKNMDCTNCTEQLDALDAEWEHCLSIMLLSDCTSQPFCTVPPENMPCILDFEAYSAIQIELVNSQNAFVNSMRRLESYMNGF